MVTKTKNYEAAAQKLQALRGIGCFSEEYYTALEMGAKALETMSALEKLNEVTPLEAK